ncbi:MAG: hypothetical protein JNK05_13665 [Myxococcales bacterium]|nr:hypothetical protein [Myxococcales bacterium]
MTAFHLCVEGTKGAGKTTTIAAVRASLEREGWLVEAHALFHEGNDWATTQGFEGGVPMMECAREPNERIVRWLIERARAVREAFVSAHASEERPALLLSDRGWITLHAYLYEGAWAKDASQRAAIDALWASVVSEAPVTVFVHTKPAVTAERRRGALDAVSGLQTEERLRADYERRLRVAREHPQRIARSWETGTGPFIDLAPDVVEIVKSVARITQ